MNKQSLVITAFAVLVVVLLTVVRSCDAEREATIESDDLQSVTVMLDWTPNVNHVGLFIAQTEGFFADEGLKVEIIEPGEVYPAAAVLSGRVEFAIDYQEYLTLLSEEQTGLVSIAALLQGNTSGFAVRSAGGVESIADFAGLTYGSFAAPFEEPTLRALLECAGSESGVESITFVPVGSDSLTMLDQRRADIVWIFYGTQGFQAEEIGAEIDYFPMRDHTDCIPDYYTPILIAAQEYITAEPETVRKFLAALDAAYNFIAEQPGQAAEVLADAVPELNRAELRRSVPWLTQYTHDSNGAWGGQEEAVWSEYAAWMHRQGLLSARVDRTKLQSLFTNEYLPQ